jgi:phage terminase small subunit
MAGSDKPLTANQKRFVEEYAADGNATQAYFRAYGRRTSSGKLRTYRTAQVQASKLLSTPIIAAEVKAAHDAYAARVRVTKARVLREVAAVAFADPADAFDPDPNGGPLVAKKLHDIPAATRRAIQSVKVKRRRIAGGGNEVYEVYEVEEVEYKFASKMDALEKLFKKLGFYAGDPEEAAKTLASVVRTYALIPDNGRGPTTPAGPSDEVLGDSG